MKLEDQIQTLKEFVRGPVIEPQDAGYDQARYDQVGYDQAGYGRAGYDRVGYDNAGYDNAPYQGHGYNGASYGSAGYEDGSGWSGGDPQPPAASGSPDRSHYQDPDVTPSEPVSSFPYDGGPPPGREHRRRRRR